MINKFDLSNKTLLFPQGCQIGKYGSGQQPHDARRRAFSTGGVRFVSLEILGVLLHRNASEISPVSGPKFDLEMLGKLAQAYDQNGFDRVLILQNSFAPDPFALAVHAASLTKRLAFMVAHRPGFIAPTMAARMFATLDNLSGGRAGIHVITGANDAELQCDGDFLTKDKRYLRSREFVTIMRQIWNSGEAVDFEGDFYRVVNSMSELKPVNPSGIPVYWGGSSPLALEVGGEVADVFALGGLKPLAQMEKSVAEIRQAAANAGRELRIQTSVRVILGSTEEEAFAQARDIVGKLGDVASERARKLAEDANATSVGMRLDKKLSTTRGGSGMSELEELAQGPEIVDKRLWTGITKASIDFATPTLPPALVGTPEQVADAMLDYYRMGISGYLIRGFDLMGDIPLFGQELFPLLRKGVRAIDEAKSELTA